MFNQNYVAYNTAGSIADPDPGGAGGQELDPDVLSSNEPFCTPISLK
jgi:hypothetical protein